MELLAAKSREASQLRQRRSRIARQFGIPQVLLGGSLNGSRRKCGKPSCRCATGQGHPQWSLTLSHRGTRRVEKVPTGWLEQVERAVLDTQTFLDAIKEVMAINMELLAMAKLEQRERTRRRGNQDVRPVWKRLKKRSTTPSADRSSNM